jgi:TusA-related sulfurtransferase
VPFPEADSSLDLRGTPCPVNFIRARLALEGLEPGAVLELVLDRGEPEAMVLPGLEREGHAVSVQETTDDWLRLHVICSGG